MSQATWTSVDQYYSELLIAPDEVLQKTLESSDAAGLPQIAVSESQGKFLSMFASIQGAKRILEVGTLGGYSTIWLGRALPADGKLVSLEFSPLHAEVATSNVAAAGLSDRVEIRVGAALDTLAQMEQEAVEPFDLVFIDADKPNTPNYFDWALKFTRPGSVIIGDNVVRKGAVVDAESDDIDVQGIRAFAEKVKNEPRVDATTLQTVSSKGYDGMLICRVL